jgi:hypothetical protein
MDGKDEKTDYSLDNLIIVLVQLVILVINDESIKTAQQSGQMSNIGKLCF